MIPTLKISPSILGEFQSLINGDYELWSKTQEDFIRGLSEGFQESSATSRGHAVHRILEGEDGKTATGTRVVRVQDGGAGESHEMWYDEYDQEIEIKVYEMEEPNFGVTWQFSEQAYNEIIKHRLEGDIAYETWGRWEHEVNGVNVLMNMRHDALEPCILHDFKTTGKPKKYRDYLDSIQWRCYLMTMPEVNEVNYHIFQLPHDNPNAVLSWVKYQKFTYIREADNYQRVVNLLTELIAWAKDDARVFDALKYIPK